MEKRIALNAQSILEIVTDKFLLKLVDQKTEPRSNHDHRDEATVFIKPATTENSDDNGYIRLVFDQIRADDNLKLQQRLSLADQFTSALSVNSGDLANATLVDYFLHLISLPWKVLIGNELFLNK